MQGLATRAGHGRGDAGWQEPAGFAALVAVPEHPAADGAMSPFDTALFAPLSPVIDPPTTWRADTPGIPSTALPALGACVLPILRAADTMAALWSETASILDDAAEPAIWPETGLSSRRFPAIAAAAASVLREAGAIAALADMPPETAQADAALRALLDRVAGRGAEDWALIIQVMLVRLPAPLDLLRHLGAAGTGAMIANTAAAAMRSATELAVGALLTRLGRQHAIGGSLDSAASLHEAALDMRRLNGLLAAIGDNAGPDRRRRMDTLRQHLDARCQERFVAGMAAELLEPVAGLAAPPGLAMLTGLEAAARDLRRLETEARRFGGAAGYETLLRHASASLAALPADAMLSPIDRARLIEILTGPEDAAAVLAG